MQAVFNRPMAANGLDKYRWGIGATGQVVAQLDVRAGLVLHLPNHFGRDNGEPQKVWVNRGQQLR